MNAYDALWPKTGMTIDAVRKHEDLTVVYLRKHGSSIKRWLAFSPSGGVSELVDGCQILRDIERARMVAS